MKSWSSCILLPSLTGGPGGNGGGQPDEKGRVPLVFDPGYIETTEQKIKFGTKEEADCRS